MGKLPKKRFLWWYQDPDLYKEWEFLNALPPPDKIRFAGKMEEMRKRYGNIYFYTPIPKLRAYHEDVNTQKYAYGNNGSGKSMAAAAETAFEFIGWSPFRTIPPPDFGSKLLWIASTDSNIQKDSSQLIFFSDILSPSRDIGLLPAPEQLEEYGFEILWEEKGKIGSIVDPWIGTTLVFKSMESKLNSFAGAPLDWGWIDEVIPAEKHDELLARILRKHGRLTMSFLIQEAEDHYAFTSLYQEYQNDLRLKGSSDISFYFLEIEDNIYLDQEDIARRKKKFTAEGRSWRFSKGGFFPVEPKGIIVYEDYSPQLHDKEKLVAEFDNLSTLYRVWDLGYEHPCCTGFQIDRYNRKKIMFCLLGDNIQLRNFIDEVDAKTRELFPRCMSTHEILPHDANSTDKRGVTKERAVDVFREKGLNDYSVIYVSVETSIVACNMALGNIIKREPEIQIDIEHASLFVNMLSLYTRDTKGKPKRDKKFEHPSDNFKLLIQYCKRLPQEEQYNEKRFRTIQVNNQQVLDLAKKRGIDIEPKKDYINDVYGEYE